MKNKGLLRLFISLWLGSILGAIFLTLPIEAAPPETITLTMVSQYPLTNLTINYPARYFKKWVEAWSGGRVKIDFKGGPEIIAPLQLPMATERGMHVLLILELNIQHSSYLIS
jgi:TRAP-type mannitol/chloroaromatic compound transport system substrate-binding protein